VTEFNPGGGTIATDGSVITGLTNASLSLSLPNITITTPDLVVAGFAAGNSNNTWSNARNYTVDYSAGYSGHVGGALVYWFAVNLSSANPAAAASAKAYVLGVVAAFLASGNGSIPTGQVLLAGGF
jgi:hypothetical protein